MPSIQEIYAAIQNAQAAGDTAAVEDLTELFDKQRRMDMGLPPLPVEQDGTIKKEQTDEEAGFLENIATGLGAGYVGTTATAALGAATLLEEDSELKARKKILELQEEFTPEGGDKDSITYQLFQGVGSLGAFASTALLGKAAALPAAGILAIGAGAGEASERARAYGATEEERNRASLIGAGIGLTELTPLGRLAERLKIPGLPDLIEKISKKTTPETITGIKDRLQRMAATGVSEGAQEASAAILQNLNEAGYNPTQVAIDLGVLQEGSVGGGAGAIVQGVVDVLNRKNLRAVDVDDSVDDADVEKDKATVRGKIRLGDRHSDETQEEFEARQEKVEIENKEATDEQREAILEIEKADAEEKADVGKQATRTPDTETTGESVPSGAGVVGDERADGAEKPRGAVEGGLDDSVSDTGRPVGREGKPNDTVRNAVDALKNTEGKALKNTMAFAKKKLTPEEYAEVERLLAEETTVKESAPQELKADEKTDIKTAVPTFNPASKKFTYFGSDYKGFSSKIPKTDKTKLKTLARKPKNADTVDASQEITSGFMSLFSSPEQAIFAAANDRVKPTAQVVKKGAKLNLEVAFGKSTLNAELPFATKKELTDALGIQDSAQPLGVGQIVLDQVAKTASPKTMQAVEEVGGVEVSAKGDASGDTPEETVTDTAVNKVEEVKVDAPKGKTLTAYHRTTAEPFSEFNETHLNKKSKHSYAGTEGIYFSPKSNDESTIAFGANEAKVELTINNPVPLKTFTGSFDRKKTTRAVIDITTEQDLPKMDTSDVYFEQDGELRAYNFQKKPMQKRLLKEGKLFIAFDPERVDLESARAMKRAGYDGIIVPEGLDIPAQTVILEPKQAKIKSFTHLPTKEDITPKPKAEAKPKAKAEAKPKAKAKAAPKAKPKAKAQPKAKTEAKPKAKAQAKPKAKAQPKAKPKAKAQPKAKPKAKAKAAPKAKPKASPKAKAKKQILDDRKDYKDPKTFNGIDDLKLNPKAINALASDLPKTTVALVQKGDLKGAVLDFAKTLSGDSARVAKAMANNLGKAKVDMRTTEQLGGVVDGKIKLGQFDVNENTVSFNSDLPLTGHVLMHEVSHVVTNSGLNNKSLPATRQLTNIYNSVKGSLKGAYGAADVKEFVAEYMSNPEFKKELARLDIDGNNIPVLRLVLNAISNRLRALAGLSTKPIQRLDMDAIDTLTMALISTNLERVGDLKIAMARSPKEILDMAIEVKKATDKYKGNIADNSWAAKTYEFATTKLPNASRFIFYRLLGGQAIGDVARAAGLGDLGLKLDKAITAQKGLQMDYQEQVNKVRSKYTKWALKNRKQKHALDRVIYNYKYGATIHQVDPTKKAANYSGKKLEIWKAQRKDWELLGPEGQALFTEMRNAYKNMYLQLLDAISEQIDAMVDGNKDAAAAVKKKLQQKMLSGRALEVYFPLVRQGEYRLVFNVQGEESKEQIFMMFASKAERDAYIQDLRNDKDVDNSSIETFRGNPTRSKFNKAPSGSFTNEVLSILTDAGVSESVQDDIVKLFIDKLPETSYAKSFKRRTKKMGYIQDAGFALATKGPSLALQTAKIKSAPKIAAAAEALERKANEVKRSNEGVNELVDVLLKRAEFAVSGAQDKFTEGFIKNFNQFAFLYTLGFNVSSAIVNMSQVPLVIIPMLSGKFGLAESIDAFTSAAGMLGGSKTNIKEYYNQEGAGQDATFTLKPSVIKKIQDTAISKEQADIRVRQLQELIPLIKEANANGQLYSMSFMDELGMNESANMLDKVSHGSAIFFNAAERFNRQATLIASYNLVRKKMADDFKKGKKYFSEFDGEFIDPKTSTAKLREFAAREALYITQETNGGAVLETAPRWSQEGWGRVAGMYKSFGLQMYYTLGKTTMRMFRGYFAKTPEGDEQFWVAVKQLFGVHLSAIFFAGVSGIPLYGIVRSAFDMLLEDDEDDVDTIVRKAIKEGWYKGVVSEVFDVDVASRIKLTDLLINENRFSNSESLEQSVGFYLGGPFVSTLNRFMRAGKDYREGDYHEMFDNILPPAISNVKKAVRYKMDEGIKTRKENYILRDLSTGELVAKALGFAPTEYTFRQAQSSRNKKVEAAIINKAIKLREDYFQAVRRSDPDAVKNAMNKIAEFNNDHPAAAITNDNLNKAVKTHFNTSARMINGVTVNEALRNDIERSNENWSRGF